MGWSRGEKYLIAKDASDLFEEHIITVHRAMKILADKEILVRQRRKGTYVGPNFTRYPGEQRSPLNAVHVMMAMDYYQTSGFPVNDLIDGIKAMLPTAPIQVHYVPDHDSLGYTRDVLNQIQSRRYPEGMVLIRSSRAVQELVAERQIPAGVFGNVYPGIGSLPWLDVDQEMTGRLMASYALKAGRRKFALLMRSEWRRGDNLLLNGVTRCLGQAGLNMDSMTTLSVPSELETIEHEVNNLLGQPDAPTAILCRGDYHADIVVRIARNCGLVPGRDLTVVSGAHMRHDDHQNYPYIVPRMNNRQQVQELIRMLCDKVEGKPQTSSYVIVPVTINEPH